MSSVQPRERGPRFFQLAPALIGLLGVFIGAVATSGVTYLVAHNRGKASEGGAARIVLAEVEWNDDHLHKRPDRPTDDHLHKRPDHRLTDVAWLAERERLARSLSDVEWAWVAKYYFDLAEFRARMPRVRRRLDRDKPCTLIALNVGHYSRSKHVNALDTNHRNCKKPPDAP
jgi:hypothetical protein